MTRRTLVLFKKSSRIPPEKVICLRFISEAISLASVRYSYDFRHKPARQR
jgi:hypothetical protein